MIDNMQAAQCMNNYLDLLDDEKIEFAKNVKSLLNENYLCEEAPKQRKKYNQIQTRYKLYEWYFSMMNVELLFDRRRQVIYLNNLDKTAKSNFKKNESKVLLVLRVMYEKKRQELSLMSEIFITREDLTTQLSIYFPKDDAKKTELSKCLSLLRQKNIIDINGSIEMDDTIIRIFPTIECLLSKVDIEACEEILKSYETKTKIDETETGDEYDEEID